MAQAVTASFADRVEVRVGALTDRGRRRAVNEDSLLAVPNVYAVADGMGGHAAGDQASAIVVEELQVLLARPDIAASDVTQVLDRANARVRALGGGERAAGTTVASAVGVMQDGEAYWLVANLGDSRIYQLADAQLRQVSVDHSVVQELVDSGELSAAQAATHPQRHVVTRAVGGPQALEPDFWLLPAVDGDRLLLCSDGLTVELDDDAIAVVLLEHADPQRAAEALVAAALDAGGRDNVTVLVLDVHAVAGTCDEPTAPRAQLVAAVADITLPRLSPGAP